MQKGAGWQILGQHRGQSSPPNAHPGLLKEVATGEQLLGFFQWMHLGVHESSVIPRSFLADRFVQVQECICQSGVCRQFGDVNLGIRFRMANLDQFFCGLTIFFIGRAVAL